jgi:hypothetical protein
LIDETPLRAANDQFPSKRPSLGKRGSRVLARFVITFCVGVAATLAWQSYGDAVREIIVSSSPQLSWLAPQAAPAAASPDQQQLKAMLFGLAAMRQSVDQFSAGQEQMTHEITNLRAAQQEILDKISVPPPRPAAAPARKPVPSTPTSQAPPVR